MDVIFYYNMSDDREINKTLETGHTFQGVLREECSIMNPTIRFESSGMLRYNYAYIPEFQRYYSIVDRTVYRDGIWDVTFDVDVLMSFRNDIINLNAVVDKQTLDAVGNQYIDDSSLVTENVMFQTLYNFPAGFNNTGEYILITAG